MKKRLFTILLTFAITLSFIPMIGGIGVAFALESTGNTVLDAFINESSFTDGASWPGGKGPNLLPASWFGCAAYCADYVKYCYGINDPRSGASFTDTSEIRAGDVLIIGNPGDGTGHWFVCLKRSGNNLYVAEGAAGSTSDKVRIGWNYTISGNRFSQDSRSFTAGYHYINEGDALSQLWGINDGDTFKGKVKLWAKRMNNDSNHYGVFYIDGKAISGHLTADSNGFFSIEVDTANYGAGEHILTFKYAYTNGGNEDSRRIIFHAK